MSTATADLSKLYIDGQWAEATGGGTLDIVNPATEEPVGVMAFGTRADAARAVEAAHKALPAWSKKTAYDRAKILKKAAELVRGRLEDIARTLTTEQGKPIPEAKGEVNQAADTFEWFAEEGKRAYGQVIPNSLPGRRHLTFKHPVGVVGAISPWNFPATLAVRKIAPALAAGCTVVSKPADQTPLCLVKIYECLAEAGLPPGVANLVLAPAEEVGQEFVENPLVRKISFTGSTRVGKLLMRGAADQIKRLSLELGGHAPFVVFPDADPEAVASFAVAGKFRNNGQVCISPTRFYVHQKLTNDFTEAVVEKAKKLKLGNGLDDGVEIGPMFARQALDRAAQVVDDAKSCGAEVLAGGKRADFDRGYFYEPTVLRNVNGKMKLMTEEPFSPVMPVLDFDKIDEVIAAANDTPYGLAAYVYTNDLSVMFKVAEGLEAGMIGVNEPVPATPQAPFGGMKQSGIGRELAHEGLEAYLETKHIALRVKE